MLAYIVTGQLSTMLVPVFSYVSVFSPPTGIALAAGYLWGITVMPWIFLGAILLNIAIGYEIYTQLEASVFSAAFIIGSVAVLEAIIGMVVLRRVLPAGIGGLVQLKRFYLLAPCLCLCSAILAISGLTAISVIDQNLIFQNFIIWWLGDALGTLIFFPMTLILTQKWVETSKNILIKVIFAVFTAMVLVVSIYIYILKMENNKSFMQFNELSDQLKDQLLLRFNDQEILLEQIRTVFMDENHQISRKAFTDILQNSTDNIEAIQAIEWAPKIEAAERDYYESLQKIEFGNAFEILETDLQGRLIRAQNRDYYYPITYVEPFEAQTSLLGFDLASNPERCSALLKAVNQNRLIGTGPIQLQHEQMPQLGMLFFLPLIQNHDAAGVLITVIKMGSFIESVLPSQSSLLLVRFLDENTQKILYDSFSPSKIRPEYRQRVHFGDRQFILETAPSRDYQAQHPLLKSYLVLVAGLISVAIFLSFLLRLGVYRAIIYDKVEQS